MGQRDGRVRDEAGGRAGPGQGGDDLLRLASAWTIGVDTLARAAAAAVSASAEGQLRAAPADALSRHIEIT